LFVLRLLPDMHTGRTGTLLRLPAIVLPLALAGFFLLQMGGLALPGLPADLFVFVLGALGMALWALILLEQLFRNAREGERWNIKYICLAVATLLVYDFFTYSYSVLGQHIPTALWNARGAINGLVVPLIVVAVARNPAWT